MSACEVCEGTPGKYPVMTSGGKHLYNITCPECIGTGTSWDEDDAAEEHEQERFAAEQRYKYEQLMREMGRAT